MSLRKTRSCGVARLCCQAGCWRKLVMTQQAVRRCWQSAIIYTIHEYIMIYIYII